MLLLGLNHPLLVTPSVYPTNALRVEAINQLCIEISDLAHAVWMIQSINDTMLADKIHRIYIFATRKFSHFLLATEQEEAKHQHRRSFWVALKFQPLIINVGGLYLHTH